MSVITSIPEPNIWNEICKAAALQRPPYKDDDIASVHTDYEDFDPAKHNPVFYGKMHQKISGLDRSAEAECDPSTCHPSLAGYALVEKPAETPEVTEKPLPELKSCSPREYLESYIFPKLLPALEEMLKQAKLERCFERKRTKFNGLDFLTEFLYSNNPQHEEREQTPLGEIPFVKEHWIDHPRPPLPMSLLWTEEEASLIIQSFWRGYKVRCNPEIQELRVWQREWREENSNIKNKVDDFWARQMPDNAEDEAQEGPVEESSVGASPDVVCQMDTEQAETDGPQTTATETLDDESEEQARGAATEEPETAEQNPEAQDTTGEQPVYQSEE